MRRDIQRHTSRRVIVRSICVVTATYLLPIVDFGRDGLPGIACAPVASNMEFSITLLVVDCSFSRIVDNIVVCAFVMFAFAFSSSNENSSMSRTIFCLMFDVSIFTFSFFSFIDAISFAQNFARRFAVAASFIRSFRICRCSSFSRRRSCTRFFSVMFSLRAVLSLIFDCCS
jgi:hypothetical protein